MNLAINRQMNVSVDPNEELWRAVVAKDARFDGRFVFAVSSTGIYCRPSCPSRRPQRERVAFFNLPEAAEEAGYRACLRCHPEANNQTDPQVAAVRSACRFIEQHQDEHLNLDLIGAHVGLSSFHLQRTFKRLMGITPKQYAEACRAARFKTGVRQGESVTNAMYDAGYGSSSRLYERSTAELGMTPATYGKGGRGARIDYTIGHSSLGLVLVAATHKGICAVRIGDSEDALESNLRAEFPVAEITRDDQQLHSIVNKILDHLSGKQPHLDLPLDIQATAFQRQVWEALRSIPYGSTRSYSEVAKTIGRPTAVRAVARACATNPVALVIPCHRVIREDQSLGGYRWGLERKKKLLAGERSREQ